MKYGPGTGLSDRDFRILVVDDTEDIRELLRMRLIANGYGCLTAENGLSGLAAAQEHRPDLILLDLMMPDMNGYEVCRQLKQSPATRRIPVIFLTARTDVVDRVQGLALGAVDYINKPFDSRELLARVEVALRTKRMMDDLERANSELRASSVTDAMTRLYNRRYFEERLSEELAGCERNGVAAACLLLDLDHFKQVNDSHGHLAGDDVIRQFAEILRQRIRRGDVAARFGGDEFAVLMAGVTSVGARAASEKIRQAVEEARFWLDGATQRITTSIGVACFPLGEGTRVEQILEQADRALYKAKELRNRVELGEETLAFERAMVGA